MFYDQRMEDAGVPPWCAGLSYGRSNPPKSDSFDTTDNTTDKLGAFKYVEASSLKQEGVSEVFEEAVRCVVAADLAREAAVPPPPGNGCAIS